METLYRNSPYPIRQLFSRCGGSPLQVLGVTNPVKEPISFDPMCIITYTSKSRSPCVYCPESSNLMIQVIVFDKPLPTKMQYLSLDPISLALSDKPYSSGDEGSPFDQIEVQEESERKRKKTLVEKLQLHTVTNHPPSQKELSLPHIVDQMNCSYELGELIEKNVGLIGVRIRRTLSVSERVVESANDLWDYVLLALKYIWIVWLHPLAAQLFLWGLMAHRIAGEVILVVLESRLSPNGAAIKDVFATAQQVDIRLQQFCYWPIQYITLSKRKSTWQSVTTSHPEYIRFYNSLWLVANDVIIGIALGSYIIENADFVASRVDTVFHAWSIEGLRRMIMWLMEWPGGLKLNTELAKFLGDLFIWVIDHWGGKLPVVNSFVYW
jgi:phosphatidylinositol N-acetylglucosaminyltransferase subunit Q